MPVTDTRRSARFGAFTLDIQSGELRKHGTKLKLAEQPFQILSLLLERPGELVSREELHKRLWTSDTFVDFDHGLNSAIRKLRDALGESQKEPHWIETIPRRGYRFLGEVEWQSNGTGTKHLASGVLLEKDELQKSVRRPFWPKLLVALAALGAACALVAFWYIRPKPPTVSNIVQISNSKAPGPTMLPLVTDGVRLYFIEGWPVSSGSVIAQLSVKGGEIVPLSTTVPNAVAVLAISPDRSELLIASGITAPANRSAGRSAYTSEVWLQPLTGGAPHRVGKFYATFATWTPDGRGILYADGKAIWTVDKNGGSPAKLADVPDFVFGLRYSPDGRRIRFSREVSPEFGTGTIWEMDADGKRLHPLLPSGNSSVFRCCGEWSPDGKDYYFLSGRDTDQAIWVLPQRSSLFAKYAARPYRLTTGPLHYGTPVPSADGKRVFAVGEEVRVEPLQYDLRTGRFDSFLHGLPTGTFDFSPDKKWIVYVSYPEMTLWRARADGTDKVQLTFAPVRAYSPRWSPDGGRIAFLDISYSSPWKAKLIPASGGTPELLAQDQTDEVEDDPTWMPDGNSVVLGRVSISKGTGAIYRWDLNRKSISMIPNSSGFTSPRVSPDGKYICAISDGFAKLKLFSTATNQWSTLATGELLGFNEWSHDGKYIYMRRISEGTGELVRVRVSDRAIEHVLSLKDFPQVQDKFAWWIGLTPEDDPVLTRDRSLQEIYALDLHFP